MKKALMQFAVIEDPDQPAQTTYRINGYCSIVDPRYLDLAYLE